MISRPARAILIVALSGAAVCPAASAQKTPQWWKGTLHTHSLWSDGADFPEMIAAWYKEHGYNFLGITEHDMLQQGSERWVDMNAKDEPVWPPRNAAARAALPGYLEKFGTPWVEERKDGTKDFVRLRPLSDYRRKFEEPGRFSFILGEEITDKQGAHINAFNLQTAIRPRGGATTAERIRNNLALVEAQRRSTKRPIVAIVNHPNYVWTLTAEEIAAIPDAHLFEVYNGHTLTNSRGDSLHASTDRMWDVILSLRHAAGGGPIWGVASDDAHEYRSYSDTIAMPGRGWLMVKARTLGPEPIARALVAGDFYASTGVTLSDVTRDAKGIHIKIAAEPGVTYHTQFIGTRKGTSLASEPVVDAKGDTLRTTRIYGPGVGEVLAEMDGTAPVYKIKGNEEYVRAKITSSKPQIDPLTGKNIGYQTAWVQPVFRSSAR